MNNNKIVTNTNANDDHESPHNYVRLDRNRIHPLAYILRITRYGKFMARLSNELVHNIKYVDKELGDMQKAIQEKGMKRSSRTGMAWVRRMESKMSQIKSLKISLNVLPKILKIEESNKIKFMLLNTWQRSFDLSLNNDHNNDDDDDDGIDHDDQVDAISSTSGETIDENKIKNKKEFPEKMKHSRLRHHDRRKLQKQDLTDNNNFENNNTINDNDNNDNDNTGRLLHRFMAPIVYANQHVTQSLDDVSLQNHRIRITENYRQAKNQNKEMSTIVQDNLPSASESVQNFIGDYYCLCSGCQTMYNKQYKHLFGSYESHIGNEDMTATGKFFCIDCWNYYLIGKKKYLNGLKNKENNNNDNNNDDKSPQQRPKKTQRKKKKKRKKKVITTTGNNGKNIDEKTVSSNNSNNSTSTENSSEDDIDCTMTTTTSSTASGVTDTTTTSGDDDADAHCDSNQNKPTATEENDHTNNYNVDDGDNHHMVGKSRYDNSCGESFKHHVTFSNDMWVEFLLQTGSIIALNDYMDEILGAED